MSTLLLSVLACLGHGHDSPNESDADTDTDTDTDTGTDTGPPPPCDSLDVTSCAARADCHVTEATPIAVDAKGNFCADYDHTTGVGCADAGSACLGTNWGTGMAAPADCWLFQAGACPPFDWVGCKSSDMQTVTGC